MKLKVISSAAALFLCLVGCDGGGGDDTDPCVASGGTVEQSSCCPQDGYPNTCVIGACGCAPANLVTIPVCACPANHCFDGTACVPQ